MLDPRPPGPSAPYIVETRVPTAGRRRKIFFTLCVDYLAVSPARFSKQNLQETYIVKEIVVELELAKKDLEGLQRTWMSNGGDRVSNVLKSGI